MIKTVATVETTKANTVIILNDITGDVDIHEYEDADIQPYDDFEDYLVNHLDYNLNNCQYMSVDRSVNINRVF